MGSVNYSAIKNWDDACNAASELYPTEESCGGTEAETFMAGWTNAADMIDDKELDANDDAEILRFVFAEFDNMGYKR